MNATKKFNKKYLIVVLDMYSYGDKYDHSDYDKYEEAVFVSKDIISSSFSKRGDEGYEEWLRFGEDAVIVPINGTPDVPDNLKFSGQKYVRQICGLDDDFILV